MRGRLEGGLSFAPTPPAARACIQPLWLRVTHALNAVAVLALMGSGWRIYDASPIFALRFDPHWVLGTWLGGALLWHFAAMWLLVGNGLIYLVLATVTGRWRRWFLPVRPRDVAADLWAALRGRLAHEDDARYNAVQRLAYLGAIALVVLAALSGLAVWKSVQFPLLRAAMGGYDNARVVHFFAMVGILAFLVLHVAMALLHPRTLRLIVLGR